MASEAERVAMRRAIAISTDALGTTNPNPCVGAVVLDAGGNVIGEGITQPVGGDHAEVVALNAAGDAAQGGTVVVTLEPCSHVGRTQPCTDRIRGCGVARVVYALADPHPAAAGGGAVLRAAGVDVEVGLLADEAEPVLGRWTTAVARGRPHVTWKYASTLDGRTAALDGTSQWITGGPARRDVHRERYLADAVIVGIGTVLADDPQLTVRDWPADRQPTRVVVDTAARTPLTAHVVDGTAPTVIVVASDAPQERVAALSGAGATVVAVSRSGAHVDLHAVVEHLAGRDVAIALLEGGATLATAFIRAGLVDRVVGYHAATLLGGGRPLLGDIGVSTLTAATRLTLDDVRPVGDDVRIEGRILAGSR
jgi:diaminohydroxyphosphoribosylaminopyrimidine deaminase / 5-amino-6-(5-phosphoribosylamino)uracil reductase